MIAVMLALGLTQASWDEGGPSSNIPTLNLADLAPYRAALSGRPGGESVPVTFRQLWGDPERFQGRRVRVEGQVLRRFRQGAFGTFPPLVEAWAVAPAGDPFCLVFPDPNPSAEPSRHESDAAPGAFVGFEGVFLRLIRYQGGDVPRLAPLIVGDRPPTVTKAAPLPVRLEDARGLGGILRGWWPFVLALAALVGIWLARRHLRTPRRSLGRASREVDPPLEFVEPDANP